MFVRVQRQQNMKHDVSRLPDKSSERNVVSGDICSFQAKSVSIRDL